jgi:predicted nucleic acid-binding protein
MNLVVDASVAAKWYIPEDYSEEAELLFDDRLELHAPELIIPEFGNIILKKYRQGDIDEEILREIAGNRFSRQVVLHSQELLLHTALIEAAKTGQAVYDWIYLALAVALDCKFVTADRRFFLAMRKTPFRDSMTWVENIASLL